MKKLIIVGLSLLSLFGCSGGGDNLSQAPVSETTAPQIPSTQTQAIFKNFSTTITTVANQTVDAFLGGVVSANVGTVSDVKLTVPVGALNQDTAITISMVDNPQALPKPELNFVGKILDLGPDGTEFNKSATIEIPFTDKDLETAGVESKTSLKLYSFSKSTGVWSEEKIVSIDTLNNIVTGQVNHFSFYALVGLSGMPPEDLGTPQPGDLLFKLTSYDGGKTSGWVPAHVGVFTGEKKYDGKGLATPYVVFFGKYNTVESMIGVGVRYAYYNIPNTIESYLIDARFEYDSVYMGARELKFDDVTMDQRKKIIEFVENQISKPYVDYRTLYGLRDGKYVKGPDAFNCVGLAEAAYEFAGVHNGYGIVANDDNELLSPAKMYAQTKPAGGNVVLPVIEWASLSPDWGTTQTEMLAQISVSHEYGLDFIESVTYMTDNGFIDPNIPINDQGLYGDIKAGDGIYSAKAQVGGNQSDGVLGLNFAVTDKNGKSISIRKEFKYVIVITVPVNYYVSKKPISENTWGKL